MLLRDYLQQKHGISRRKITTLINQGEVFLNNKGVENYKTECKEKDLLYIKPLGINGNINIKDTKLPKLLAFNKPMGFTCSKSDAYNKTFYELLPNHFKKHYYYIGRLDKESRGLMLLTTDSKLVNEFEHPSKEIKKIYIIQLNKPFNRNLKPKILQGIQEGGELLRTLSLEKGEQGKIIITLNEGKKRHIRRIFKALGYQVTDLQRITIGNYHLGDLKEGNYKPI